MPDKKFDGKRKTILFHVASRGMEQMEGGRETGEHMFVTSEAMFT